MRVNFKYDENGDIKVVEDPNGMWELVPSPKPAFDLLNQNIKVDKLPPNYVAGVDPYQTHKCDLCDKEFNHEPLPVTDENYNVDEGIISCGCHIYTGEDD